LLEDKRGVQNPSKAPWREKSEKEAGSLKKKQMNE